MKTAVVTGSTKGIGKATGFALLKRGFYVYFNYASDNASALQLEEEIKLSGYDKFSIIKAELSSRGGVEGFVNRILSEREDIDVLVLNASKTIRKDFHNMSYDEYMDVMDTNLNLPYYMLKLLDKAINQNGSIVFTSSIMGQYPHATCLPYGVSKAGINFMVKCLTKDFFERGITINAVCPGFTNTPWQNEKSEEQRKRIKNKIASHRFAEPEEIANTILHIIDTRYINGAIINVDGGYSYC